MIITGEGKVVGSGPGELEPWSGSGLAGASWTDASTAQPDLFVPLRRGGGMGYVAEADHVTETWVGDGTFRVAHTVVSRSVGSTTGEVSVLWDCSRYSADLIHQVGPAFAIDCEAADPTECGITMNGDISLGYTVYAQNVPRFDPMSDAFNYTTGLYEVFTDTIVTNAPHLLNQGRHWLTLRVTATHFAAYWDGTRLGIPVAIPAWAAGRDSWGVHIVSISRIAQDDPGAQLDTWCWRPWSGTL